MPRWLPRALLGAAAVLLLLVLLWYALLRPTIESAAEEAVAEQRTTPSTLVPPDGGGGGGGGGGDDEEEDEDGGGEDVSVLGNAVDGRLFLTESGTRTFDGIPEDTILQVTDIVLQNPNGDSGRLQIRRGDTVLLVVELSNFRDLDYHFVAPIVFTASDTLVLSVECTSESCTPGMYFAGFFVQA